MEDRKNIKVLFVLKYREVPTEDEPHRYGGLSSGLLNSATFVVNMLKNNGIETKVVQCLDNNYIDAEVTAFKPTHVIIEALWVVPEKFAILTKLHPTVKWIIRLHSDTPFAAGEGIFVEWVSKYLDYGKNMHINCNSDEMYESIKVILEEKYRGFSGVDLKKQLSLLKNYYPVHNVYPNSKIDYDKLHINISCFGAIRPLKNQLLQAIAAIKFANETGKTLHFHINVGREEMNGNPVLKNILSLFAEQPKHKLVLHQWKDHHTFMKTVATMDIGMQVSYTETFNIVSADHVVANVPVLVSPEIEWVAPFFKADPNDIDSITEGLHRTWNYAALGIHNLNKRRLATYSKRSEKAWLKFMLDTDA